jgi:hypothetical protein
MTRVGLISPYASLETNSEEASRLSFACVFSSSEEFEAALIKDRRAAGHYGRAQHQRHSVIGIAAGLLIIVSLLILVF